MTNHLTNNIDHLIGTTIAALSERYRAQVDTRCKNPEDPRFNWDQPQSKLTEILGAYIPRRFKELRESAVLMKAISTTPYTNSTPPAVRSTRYRSWDAMVRAFRKANPYSSKYAVALTRGDAVIGLYPTQKSAADALRRRLAQWLVVEGVGTLDVLKSDDHVLVYRTKDGSSTRYAKISITRWKRGSDGDDIVHNEHGPSIVNVNGRATWCFEGLLTRVHGANVLDARYYRVFGDAVGRNDTILHVDEKRGYVLRRTPGGRYRAGCRDYSLEDAILHWGPDISTHQPAYHAALVKEQARLEALSAAFSSARDTATPWRWPSRAAVTA